MARPLSVIGAPSSAGAYAPGQERAPHAFRHHGLLDALTQVGLYVRDRGDVAGFRWRPDLAQLNRMNLTAVRDTAIAVADRVAEALSEGDATLVLGGDCTIELGTVAGALRDESSVALVYIDLDVDLNPPAASDGALDWTVVAHLLQLPGTASELNGLGSRQPILQPTDILFLAADAITPGEARTIEDLSLRHISLAAVQADPVGAASQAVEWAARYRRLLVHLDVDVLSFVRFPIAENVRRRDGLDLETLSTVLATLTAASNWCALTVTEVNPDHAPDERESFRCLIRILCSALSGGDRTADV